MAEQVRRLTKLATELLDLSRLDAGRLRVEHEPIDVAALARVAVEEFAAVARTSGVPLRLDAPDEVLALGDELRVLQIARALVENGLVHARAPVAVRARAESGLPLLEVEDEGSGIPPEHADHVFDRFYRVEGTLASGSGLGLAIARELAQLMGGSLEVDSRPGRTVFRLGLPAAAVEDVRPGARAAAAAG
jgi:signal transduction histidine kinase